MATPCCVIHPALPLPQHAIVHEAIYGIFQHRRALRGDADARHRAVVEERGALQAVAPRGVPRDSGRRVPQQLVRPASLTFPRHFVCPISRELTPFVSPPIGRSGFFFLTRKFMVGAAK